MSKIDIRYRDVDTQTVGGSRVFQYFMKFNPMRCMTMKASSILLTMAVLGSLMMGCSKSDKPQFTLQDEHYQQIFERQKAGITPEPKGSGDLSGDLSQEMTQEEFERLGDMHFQQGDFQTAKLQYEKVLDMEPERIATRYKLAVIYLEKGRAQQAYDEFHEILDHQLNFALAYEGMGRALMKMEKDVEAEREFQAALLYDSELWTSTNYLGIVADRRHDHKDAIRMYEVALDKHANNPAILNNLGMAYFLDEQYENAVQTFQQALQTGGNNKRIANNLGMVLTKLEHYDLAFDAYSRGMDAAKAYNNIGVAFLGKGNFAKASRCFEKALEIEPTFYEKAKENLSVSNRMLHKLPVSQQQTLIRQEQACL